MAAHSHDGGAEYREQLADIVRRARNLETRARKQRAHLEAADPSFGHWTSIERRYATVRGNAEHLLQVRSRRRRGQFWARLMRRLILL